jgi:hypothetical protein
VGFDLSRSRKTPHRAGLFSDVDGKSALVAISALLDDHGLAPAVPVTGPTVVTATFPAIVTAAVRLDHNPSAVTVMETGAIAISVACPNSDRALLRL